MIDVRRRLEVEQRVVGREVVAVVDADEMVEVAVFEEGMSVADCISK